MSKRTLLVGLDLGERYSQLAVYDPARGGSGSDVPDRRESGRIH